MLSLVKISQVI